MSDIYQDIRPADVALGQIYKGIIHTPPLNFSAQMSVLLPDVNPDIVFHNVKWQARDNMSLPQVEDSVLVIFDNQNEPWMITWWPAVRNPTITYSPYTDGFPVNPVDGDIWFAENAQSNGARIMYQYDGAATAWHQISGAPFPVVNGQWVKGVGGAAVWSGITPVDVANIPYGTTLPASPYNGQEAILVDSVTAPTWHWRLRYNAGSSSAFKWGFIGGTPLIGSSPGAISLSGVNTWQSVVAAALVAPRTGNYMVAGVGVASHSAGGVSVYLGIYINSVTNIPVYADTGFPTAGGYTMSLSVQPTRVNGIGAGQAVGLAAQTNGAGGSMQLMGWTLLPLEVQ
jgi:hypothetical protein